MPAFAQVDPMPYMPQPGVMVHLSREFTPAYLKGIVIHPEDPLKFDFIIYKGDKPLSDSQKREEYTKLTKYFLASLAIPDEDQWVNLSPYEKDRIIKDDFGKTEMGRDLLAQDYMLKQITASLIYPEDNLGKKFWSTVYAKAQQQYGTTNIPVNTFNKVWILPDDALIYEKGNTAYILRNHLRVMLEEDYLSLQKHLGIQRVPGNKAHAIASKVVREIVLPELQREVNEGKNFAALRQVYSGMLLATWFKRELKASLLGQIYANKAKIRGVDYTSSIVIPAKAGIYKKNDVEGIYQQYLKAYKKGVFNFIKEDVDKYTNETIPRKYFSGGAGDYAMAEKDLGLAVVKETSDSVEGDRAELTALPNLDVMQAEMGRAGASAAMTVTMRLNMKELRNLFEVNGVKWRDIPIDVSNENTARVLSELIQRAGIPAEQGQAKIGLEGAKVIMGLMGQQQVVAGIVLDRGYIIELMPTNVDYGGYLQALLFTGKYLRMIFDPDEHIKMVHAINFKFEPREDGAIDFVVNFPEQGSQSPRLEDGHMLGQKNSATNNIKSNFEITQWQDVNGAKRTHYSVALLNTDQVSSSLKNVIPAGEEIRSARMIYWPAKNRSKQPLFFELITTRVGETRVYTFATDPETYDKQILAQELPQYDLSTFRALWKDYVSGRSASSDLKSAELAWSLDNIHQLGYFIKKIETQDNHLHVEMEYDSTIVPKDQTAAVTGEDPEAKESKAINASLAKVLRVTNVEFNDDLKRSAPLNTLIAHSVGSNDDLIMRQALKTTVLDFITTDEGAALENALTIIKKRKISLNNINRITVEARPPDSSDHFRALFNAAHVDIVFKVIFVDGSSEELILNIHLSPKRNPQAILTEQEKSNPYTSMDKGVVLTLPLN